MGEAESGDLVKDGLLARLGEAGLPLLDLVFRAGSGQAHGTQNCGLLWRMWLIQGLSCEQRKPGKNLFSAFSPESRGDQREGGVSSCSGFSFLLFASSYRAQTDPCPMGVW